MEPINTNTYVNPPQQPTVVDVNAPKTPQNRWRNTLTTVLVVIAAPLIAVTLTSFVFQSYQVDGPSMETTLSNKDRLLVLKTRRTWARITRTDYIPARETVVVFTSKSAASQTSQGDKQLIKRVIGTPGDRVVIKDKRVTIYNKEHTNGFDPDQNSSIQTRKSTDREVEVVVEPGQVFVLGDNRAVSYDSRFFGPISVDDIVGTLAIRILPLDRIKAF